MSHQLLKLLEPSQSKINNEVNHFQVLTMRHLFQKLKPISSMSFTTTSFSAIDAHIIFLV